MTIKQLGAYVSFLDEAANFHRAKAYLFTVLIAVDESPDTKLATAHKKFAERLKPNFSAPHDYFVSRLFIAHIAAFEIFLQDTLLMVIHEHPKKVGSAEFNLTEILEASDVNELVDRAGNALISRIMYKRPLEYLQEVCKILSIDQSKLALSWGHFIEAKARRDLGVHNAWRCNEIYLRKVREAGLPTALSVGDLAIPQSSDYLDSIDSTLSTLAETITDLVLKKFWPEMKVDITGDA